MKLENKIIVKASIETVWGLLENIEAVASCVPGASAEKINDDEYTIVMSVRLGPLQMSYGGLLKIVDRDPDNYRVTFNAKAKDKKGQGTAASKTVASLISTGDETEVIMDTDLKLTGRIAQMGRGLIPPVATQIIDQTAENIVELLSNRENTAPDPSAITSEPIIRSKTNAKSSLRIWDLVKAMMSGWFKRDK